RAINAQGTLALTASPSAVWQALLDIKTLTSIIPGCHHVEQVSQDHFRADVTLAVGPVKGRYCAEVKLSDLVAPTSATLTGRANGALASAAGTGHIKLHADGDRGTILAFDYEVEIGGKAAAIGGRLLDAASRIVIERFFKALARMVEPAREPAWRRWLTLLRTLIARTQ